jgi:hypothetical protein
MPKAAQSRLEICWGESSLVESAGRGSFRQRFHQRQAAGFLRSGQVNGLGKKTAGDECGSENG